MPASPPRALDGGRGTHALRAAFSQHIRDASEEAGFPADEHVKYLIGHVGGSVLDRNYATTRGDTVLRRMLGYLPVTPALWTCT